MGGVFVIETLSVMIQVASFKLTGKRVFRMAPIHHHFELKGWPEPRVIVRFWIISVVLVLIGLATLKLRQVAAGRDHRAHRCGRGDGGVQLDRLDEQPVLLPQPPPDLPGGRHRAGGDCRAHRAEVDRAVQPDASAGLLRAAAGSVHAGPGQHGQRRAPLDQPGHLQVPDGRGGEGAVHRLAVQLPGALPRRGQRDLAGDAQAAGRGRCAGGAAAAAAGLRFLDPAAGDHRRHAGAGWGQHAAHVDAGEHRPGRHERAGDHRAQGDGYQLSNALMAVGRGEWTGVGLGNSVQKLYYLPEAHTDFIFSVTAEEFGFLGTCVIVALYALLVGRTFWLGMRCVEMKRHFSGYIAFGIGLWISMQTFVSIGVNLGILPTKGLTLPLISSGGSSVLMTCVAMGLLLRVSYELKRAERRQAVRIGGGEDAVAEPQDEPVAPAAAHPPAVARRTDLREAVMSAAHDTARPVMILAGGTGGHIFPGLAVARVLRERGVPVTWMGADGAMETRLVPQHDIAIDTLAITGLRGKGKLALLAAPWRLMRALRAAGMIIRKRQPRAVVAFGGFASGPGGMATRLHGLPLIVHEQNRAPGLTNRILSRYARRLLTGFPGTFAKREEFVGNPVRAEIAAIAPPEQRFADRHGPLRVRVVGGSQGARALNTGVPQAIAALGDGVPVQVRHQSGEKMHAEAVEAYAKAGVQAEITPFIADMADAFAWADLVVCRAGASTLAELCAVDPQCGVPG
ncbi:hypothetical protein G6F68_009411 [Rhizopus microsporus]|nr:hypothetical protein G6F68_009411 [Rhizopus microsporus]